MPTRSVGTPPKAAIFQLPADVEVHMILQQYAELDGGWKLVRKDSVPLLHYDVDEPEALK